MQPARSSVPAAWVPDDRRGRAHDARVRLDVYLLEQQRLRPRLRLRAETARAKFPGLGGTSADSAWLADARARTQAFAAHA
jgi:hypothetical protein